MTAPEDRDGFDPEECFHAEQDPGDPVTTTVVTTVAAIEGVRPETLPPLGEVVDTDALDDLLDSAAGDDCWLVFEYDGYEVTVVATGDVWVRELESA